MLKKKTRNLVSEFGENKLSIFLILIKHKSHNELLVGSMGKIVKSVPTDVYRYYFDEI